MRVGKANGGDWLRLSEAAGALGVSVNTVRRWSDSGSLRCFRSPGGHRRFRREDVDALLADKAQGAAGLSASPVAPELRGDPSQLERARLVDLRAPLAALAQVAAEAIGVTDCAFVLLSGDHAASVIAEHPTDGASQRRSVPYPAPIELLPIAAEVSRNMRRLVIGDMAATALLAKEAAEACLARGYAAVIAVPVDLGRSVLGTMVLTDWRASRTFTGANVTFAEFIARQAGFLAGAGLADGGVSDQTVTSLHLPRGAPPSTRHGGDGEVAAGVLATALRLRDEVAGLLEVYGAEAGLRSSGALDAARDAGQGPDGIPAAAAGAPAAASDARTAPSPVRAAPADRPPSADGDLVAQALNVLQESASFAVCTLYDLDGDAVTVAATTDATMALDAWAFADDAPAAAALAGRAPVTMTVGQLSPKLAERLLTDRGLAAVLLVPLVDDDRAVGLLEAGASSVVIGDAALRLGTATADLLAAARGHGARLARLQRRNRELEAVIEAGLQDTALRSTDDVLHDVASRLSEVTRCPVVDLYALEGETLRALVSHDGGRFDDEWAGVVIPLARYPQSRRAVHTREACIAASLEDPALSDEARVSLEKWGYQSQLSLPLVSGGKVIGLAELSDYSPHDFGADLELVYGLGRVAAHALENAILSDQAERRSTVLNDLAELAALTSRTRDFEALLGRIAERLLAALDAANCDIYGVGADGLRCVASFDRSGFDPQPVGNCSTWRATRRSSAR